MKNIFSLALLPVRFVIHMAAMKPTVPQTRMGGNDFTTSMPAVFKAL